jgi:hypothetical protein
MGHAIGTRRGRPGGIAAVVALARSGIAPEARAATIGQNFWGVITGQSSRPNPDDPRFQPPRFRVGETFVGRFVWDTAATPDFGSYPNQPVSISFTTSGRFSADFYVGLPIFNFHFMDLGPSSIGIGARNEVLGTTRNLALSFHSPTGPALDPGPPTAFDPGAFSTGSIAFRFTSELLGESSFVGTATLVEPVPEPATRVLVGTGGVFALGYAWRRRRRRAGGGSGRRSAPGRERARGA